MAKEVSEETPDHLAMSRPKGEVVRLVRAKVTLPEIGIRCHEGVPDEEKHDCPSECSNEAVPPFTGGRRGLFSAARGREKAKDRECLPEISHTLE